MNGLRLCLLHLLLERQISSDFVCLKLRITCFTVPYSVYFFFGSNSFFLIYFPPLGEGIFNEFFFVCASVSDSVGHSVSHSVVHSVVQSVSNEASRCFVHIVLNSAYKSIFWVSRVVRERFSKFENGDQATPPV